MGDQLLQTFRQRQHGEHLTSLTSIGFVVLVIFKIVEDYAGNDKLVGTFRTSGEGETGGGSAKSGNYRIGNFWRDDTVSSLTSLRLFNGDGTTAFQTGTTMSLYSLSKT